MMESDERVQATGSRGAFTLSLALCADAKFYEGLEMAVCSALVSSCDSCGTMRFHVFDGGLEEKQKGALEGQVERLALEHGVEAAVHWRDLPAEFLEEVKDFPGHPSLYVRLYLVDFLPEEDWVVWVDADIFCMKDLGGIERHLEPDSPFAAVVDHTMPALANETGEAKKLNTRGFDLGLPYRNAGLCLLNLKLWREEQLLPILLRWGRGHLQDCVFADQSILNWNFADRAAALPIEYNLFGRNVRAVTRLETRPVNYHSVGKNKMWVLAFDRKFKEAEITFGGMVMAFHYHKFRQEQLGTDESARLRKLREAIVRHTYFQPADRVQRAYAFKVVFYTLLLHPTRRRRWLHRKRLHKERHAQAKQMLEDIVGAISEQVDEERNRPSF